MTSSLPGANAGEPTLATLERELAYLVRALEAVQRRRPMPLERAQYLLLGILEQEGPQPIAMLAGMLMLDDSTVTRQVAVMETENLVDRVPNPADGRSTLVRATRHGLDTCAHMRDARLGRVALLFDAWTDDERRAMAGLMAKLNASLKVSLGRP